jgi:hypothetical protein
MAADDGKARVAADISRVLCVDAAAKFLGNTPKAVRQLQARRLLPYHKIGNRVIFLKEELEAFLRDLPGCTLAEAQANLAARTGKAR